jgi:inactivated superfamily I helicase
VDVKVETEKNAADSTVEIPTSDLLMLAVEHWRLATWPQLAAGSSAAVRHATRRIGDVLARWKIEARSLDGVPFDAGLAAKVIDIVEDPTTPAGTETVDETLSPLVIFRGTVIRAAEVVVRRGVR